MFTSLNMHLYGVLQEERLQKAAEARVARQAHLRAKAERRTARAARLRARSGSRGPGQEANRVRPTKRKR
jgi:hypothetical protein